MTQVTREHKVGLELALEKLSNTWGEFNSELLKKLIAQASAAPEQEAVAWLLSVEGYKDVLVDNYQRALSEQEHFLGRGRTCVIRNLYTHADPSEVQRLRAENKRLDLALAQADHNYDCDRAQFEQKLAEAQALLRRAEAYVPTSTEVDLVANIKAFLSATAQPAQAIGIEGIIFSAGDRCLVFGNTTRNPESPVDGVKSDE